MICHVLSDMLCEDMLNSPSFLLRKLKQNMKKMQFAFKFHSFCKILMLFIFHLTAQVHKGVDKAAEFNFKFMKPIKSNRRMDKYF